ncbi:hypothetical protein FHW96_004875 [Novosphingobium sp. SG751A]|uniref:hypothetical protein n=1 Tax=Novosphingobium sp. SG751A TaxID=2587000 RepID=UPI001554B7C6|nr:hypothetical protein [Novosphingobium sp. SG751A]NOW48685.1 hypothetical protein [Novosphingobium sp. SG751A]
METPSQVVTDANLPEMVKRLPQWLRSDLCSSDTLLRERAEDALIAMLEVHLGKKTP